MKNEGGFFIQKNTNTFHYSFLTFHYLLFSISFLEKFPLLQQVFICIYDKISDTLDEVMPIISHIRSSDDEIQEDFI